MRTKPFEKNQGSLVVPVTMHLENDGSMPAQRLQLQPPPPQRRVDVRSQHRPGRGLTTCTPRGSNFLICLKMLGILTDIVIAIHTILVPSRKKRHVPFEHHFNSKSPKKVQVKQHTVKWMMLLLAANLPRTTTWNTQHPHLLSRFHFANLMDLATAWGY